MKYNNELESIDTQEKAYLLGQIYGDGYTGCSNKSYRTILVSIKTDKELYFKLSKLFPFFTLKEYSSKPNTIYLENYEKSLKEDLNSLGMVSRKTSHDITGEFHFPELREDLIPHFIRGYFDADGSFWFPSRVRSRNNLRTDFGCSTKRFLLKIKEYLDSKGINFTYSERMKTVGNGNKYITYNLFSSNRSTSLKFAELIYKDANIYLQYKYDISHSKKELVTAHDLYGVCPYCGSINIKKNGKRNGKVRLKCSDCNKNFTKDNADSVSNN